jgi:hypothetical protein
MIDLKHLENEIFSALNEKTPKNLLKEYRSTTEGMMRYLLENNNIQYGDKLELGSFMRDKLLKKLTDDLSINADIDYIRLYGNIASHFGAPKFSEHDVRVVNGAYNRVVIFFYKKIKKDVPKSINGFLNRIKVNTEYKDIYEGDKTLYINTLNSVAGNDKDYPFKGLNFIGHICSKIILDHKTIIPFWMINKVKGYIYVDKAVRYIKENNLISTERIAQLESLQLFFTSTKNLSIHEKDVPKVNDDIMESLRSIINWYYKIDTTPKKKIPVKAISTTIDIVALATFGITFLLGTSLFDWNYINLVYGKKLTYIFFAGIGLGVSIFLLTFLVNLFYPYLKVLRNRKLYSISRGLTAFTGIIGVVILGLVSNWLLHDRLRDGKHLPFFIGAIVWSIFIQLSLIVKSDTNSKYDKIIRYISYFLIFVTITLVFYFSGDYDG